MIAPYFYFCSARNRYIIVAGGYEIRSVAAACGVMADLINQGFLFRS